MSAYHEQYDRMKRWYERFAAIDQGRPHDVDSDNYLDEIYAFFLNCYHLKDWIKCDSAVPVKDQQAVEDHITANRSLRLCADICNASKHLKLETKKDGTHGRSNENPTFGRTHAALQLGGGNLPTVSLKYEVDTANGSKDAFKLATECVSAWDGFLSAHGL
jgi:hypothetical protein